MNPSGQLSEQQSLSQSQLDVSQSPSSKLSRTNSIRGFNRLIGRQKQSTVEDSIR